MNGNDMMQSRQYFDKIAVICDTIDEKGWWKKPDNMELSLRDILQNDIENFIMYLSASDGEVSPEEVEAYKAITGADGAHFEHIQEQMIKRNIAAMDFESEPPLIFKLLSRAEMNAVSKGARFDSSVLHNVMALYRVIGHTIISVDGGITEEEKQDFNVIMDTIRDYVDEHDTIRKAAY
jgi:hypothetical protein